MAEWGSESTIERHEIPFEAVRTHYVRVVITGHQLPEGHTGYGYPAWIFVDEIEVE